MGLKNKVLIIACSILLTLLCSCDEPSSTGDEMLATTDAATGSSTSAEASSGTSASDEFFFGVKPEMGLKLVEKEGERPYLCATLTATEPGKSLSMSRQFKLYRVEGETETLLAQLLLDDLGMTAAPFSADVYAETDVWVYFNSMNRMDGQTEWTSLEAGDYVLKYVGCEQSAEAEFTLTESLVWGELEPSEDTEVKILE